MSLKPTTSTLYSSAISLRRGCHRDKRLGLGNMFKMGASGVVEALRDAACDAFQEIVDLGEGADAGAVVKQIAARHSQRARSARGPRGGLGAYGP